MLRKEIESQRSSEKKFRVLRDEASHAARQRSGGNRYAEVAANWDIERKEFRGVEGILEFGFVDLDTGLSRLLRHGVARELLERVKACGADKLAIIWQRLTAIHNWKVASQLGCGTMESCEDERALCKQSKDAITDDKLSEAQELRKSYTKAAVFCRNGLGERFNRGGWREFFCGGRRDVRNCRRKRM